MELIEKYCFTIIVIIISLHFKGQYNGLSMVLFVTLVLIGLTINSRFYLYNYDKLTHFKAEEIAREQEKNEPNDSLGVNIVIGSVNYAYYSINT